MDSWTRHRTMAYDIIPWKLTLISLGSSFCRGRGDIFFFYLLLLINTVLLVFLWERNDAPKLEQVSKETNMFIIELFDNLLK